MAVDRALQIDLADAFEGANKERIDSDEASGVRGLDVAFAELQAEAFKQPGLLIGKLDLTLGGRLLQTQQALMLSQQATALLHPAHPARRDLDVLEPKLLLKPHSAVAGMNHGVVEHSLLNLGGDPIGVRPRAPGSWSMNPSAP